MVSAFRFRDGHVDFKSKHRSSLALRSNPLRCNPLTATTSLRRQVRPHREVRARASSPQGSHWKVPQRLHRRPVSSFLLQRFSSPPLTSCNPVSSLAPSARPRTPTSCTSLVTYLHSKKMRFRTRWTLTRCARLGFTTSRVNTTARRSRLTRKSTPSPARSSPVRSDLRCSILTLR